MKKLNAEQKQICRRLLALLLVFIVGLTGALAFLTASDSRKNVFTVGDVDIILHEPDWKDLDNDGNFDRDDNLNHNILPGQKIPKAPYIENVGKNDAWVYITVSVPTSEIEDIYEVDGQIAISGEQLDMNVTAYAIQDGYKGGHSYTEISKYFDGKHEDLFGEEISIQEASTQLAVFKLLAYENSEKMIDDNWEQIGDVYRSVDSNGKHYNNYIFAYNKILPKGTSSEPVFRYVELYENIGEAKPVVLTYWVNNQEVEEALETMSFNTFALNGTTFSVEGADSQTASEEDLSNYTAVKTEIYNPGEKVTELYFNDELAKAGYSFDWKFSTNNTESAYAGMIIEEDTNLLADYTNRTTESTPTESDFLVFNIKEDSNGVYGELIGADRTHPNYPTEVNSEGKTIGKAGDLVIPANLNVVVNNEEVNITNGTLNEISCDLANGTYSIPVKTTSRLAYADNDYSLAICEIAKNVVFPDTVVKIGPTFRGSAEVYWEYNSNPVLESISLPYSVKETNEAFAGCINLTSVHIPSSVTEIGYRTFTETGITEIEFPESIQEIGEWAFRACTGLTEVFIPDNVHTIGAAAFKNCIGLKKVTISKGVKNLGRAAFEIVPRNGIITSTAFLDELHYLGTADDWCNIQYGEHYTDDKQYNSASHPNYYAHNFYIDGKLATDIVLTEKTTEIPDFAFAGYYGNKNLKTIVIPDSVQTVGQGAFYKCSQLESARIPDGCEYVGYRTFMGCAKLKEVYLGNTIKSIDKEAFRDTPIVKEINIPASCTEIGENAFRTCGLSKVILNGDINVNSDSYLGSFYNSGISELVIGKNAINISDYLINCSAKITIEEGNPAWRIENNFLYNNDRLMDTINRSELPANLTIKSTDATFVLTGTFSNCTNLQTVTFEEGFKEIDTSVFDGCTNLTTLNIPSSVTKIGRSLRYINSKVNLDTVADLTVNYAGTMAQWKAFNVTLGVNKVTVVCTDGTITY